MPAAIDDDGARHFGADRFSAGAVCGGGGGANVTHLLVTLQVGLLREISIFLFVDDVWCVTPFLQLTEICLS